MSGRATRIRLAYSDQDLFRRKKEVIEQSIEILRRRVDETGTIEPTIVRQGDERILLQVPGIKDTTDLKRKINQTAKLTFHLVNEDVAAAGPSANVPPTTYMVPTREGMQELRRSNPKAWEEIQAANPRMSPEQICRRYQPQCLPVLKRVVVGGEDLDDAKATFEQQQGGRPIISFTFNAAGGRAFCAATRANIGKRLAIQLDNEIISAPVVQSAICGGSGIITGTFTTQQTQEQALLLRSGALPATLTIIEERTVGADLGADAIRDGTVAALVGTALVALFMFVAYGPIFGGFANLAMLVNLLMVFAGMSILGASLTLPGIAGLVLTVGMAVDSNVLIYERVREEKALRPLGLQLARHRLRARHVGHHRRQPHDADRRRPAVRLRLGPDPRLRHHAVARSAHLDVQLDHLHPHAARRLGALAAADRTRDLRRHHVVEARSPRSRFKTKFDFLGKRKTALILSTLINVVVAGRRLRRSASISASTSRAASPSRRAPSRARPSSRSCARRSGGLGVGEVALQEFGDPSTALIRVQRQDGGAQCVAGARASC